MDRPDLAWTLLLRRRLPTVLARLFPEIHAAIDWRQEYYLPDKSLPPRAAASRTGDREPDFVALVALLDGSQACVHVEVQCTRQARFAQRMALYHARLRDHLAMPVLSMAILGDPSRNWRPDSSNDLCQGVGTTFQFRVAKLLDFGAQVMASSQARDPVTLAIAAHLLALATRHRPLVRYREKRRLFAEFPRRGQLGELKELQRIIDWMMPLPEKWQRRMIMPIENDDGMGGWDHTKEGKNTLNYLIPEYFFQKGKKMALAEGKTLGRAEGRVEGRAEGWAAGEANGLLAGKRQLLLLQIEVQFGRLPPARRHCLDRATAPQLERLAIALLDAESLEAALNAAGLRA